MRFHLFLSGAAIIAMGVCSHYVLERPDSLGFIQGALTLGGGILICGIFSMKMVWHGIIGAGVLGLLGAARGFGNVPRLVKFLAGDRSHGLTPLLEAGVTFICLLLVIKVIQELRRERVRRMLEE